VYRRPPDGCSTGKADASRFRGRFRGLFVRAAPVVVDFKPGVAFDDFVQLEILLKGWEKGVSRRLFVDQAEVEIGTVGEQTGIEFASAD
jgi:hypothetical protein